MANKERMPGSGFGPSPSYTLDTSSLRVRIEALETRVSALEAKAVVKSHYLKDKEDI